MKHTLILTVGTGTAGKNSDLTSGLSTTVSLMAPRQYYLVPSTNETSLTIADLIKGEHPESCAGIFPLEHPDDLESCRQHLRQVIVRARATLKPDEQLVINPTAGTKQMTAAATIAALDEEIGNIVFTTGERSDGVVKTGTEELTDFDPSIFFRERDLKQAHIFFEAGDFYAAMQLLKPHNAVLTHEYATALTCYHWQRFDYESARAYQPSLKNRSARDVIADILAWAGRSLRYREYDNAVALIYKALEQAARFQFHEATKLLPDKYGFYKRDQILKCCPSFPADKKDKIILGLRNLVTLLREVRYPFGTNFSVELENLCELRNALTHGIAPISAKDAQEYYELAKKHIHHSLNILPTKLPETLCEQS